MSFGYKSPIAVPKKRMKINPDGEIVTNIKFRLGLLDGYCPCHPEEMGNEDWKCPCKKFREDRECCCGLYVNDND